MAISSSSQHWYAEKETLCSAHTAPLSFNDYKIFHIEHTISEEIKKVGVER